MSTPRRNCTTGLPPSATTTISFSSTNKQKNNLIQQPLSPKPNAPNRQHNNSHHEKSNTQPMMADALVNKNGFFSNPHSSPASPSALITRYVRSDTTTSSQQILSTRNANGDNFKPLPSLSPRPLTPITYSYDFFTVNNNQNNQNKHSRKAPPKHTKNSQSQTINIRKPLPPTRRRHQATISGQNWQIQYEKLKQKHETLELEQKELKQKHGALTRSYRLLEKSYEKKCVECNELIEEKKELNRNLEQINRRDSIAKSDKSDNSMSGDFSDNKSEYSMIGMTANILKRIASPSQSALSSIPPYNPSNVAVATRKRNKMNVHTSNKHTAAGNKKLVGVPHSLFSDDGTESETSLASSNPNPFARNEKYNKRINGNVGISSRIMNGSMSSLESGKNNYKSADRYDDEQNLDPYATFTEII